jgi:hypothetical protein
LDLELQRTRDVHAASAILGFQQRQLPGDIMKAYGSHGHVEKRDPPVFFPTTPYWLLVSSPLKNISQLG